VLRWPRRPETKPEADEGPSPFEPALLLTSWTKLFLGFCLPRLSRLPIAFAKTLAASAVAPLDETRNQIIAPAIAANQFA